MVFEIAITYRLISVLVHARFMSLANSHFIALSETDQPTRPRISISHTSFSKSPRRLHGRVFVCEPLTASSHNPSKGLKIWAPMQDDSINHEMKQNLGGN